MKNSSLFYVFLAVLFEHREHLPLNNADRSIDIFGIWANYCKQHQVPNRGVVCQHLHSASWHHVVLSVGPRQGCLCSDQWRPRPLFQCCCAKTLSIGNSLAYRKITAGIAYILYVQLLTQAHSHPVNSRVRFRFTFGLCVTCSSYSVQYTVIHVRASSEDVRKMTELTRIAKLTRISKNYKHAHTQCRGRSSFVSGPVL